MFMNILKFIGILVLFSIAIEILGSLGSLIVSCIILYAIWKLIAG